MALRQSYAAGEMEKLGWLSGEMNPADPLTKLVLALVSPFFRIMVNNKFPPGPRGCSTATHEQKMHPVSNAFERVTNSCVYKRYNCT